MERKAREAALICDDAEAESVHQLGTEVGDEHSWLRETSVKVWLWGKVWQTQRR